MNLKSYQHTKLKYTLLVMFFVGMFLLSLFVGAEKIPFNNVIRLLGSRIPIIGAHISLENITATEETILLVLRLPRAIGALLIGMSLAGSGVIYQAVLENPMADPYILGVSAGAAFGASLSITLELSPTALYAFMGAAGAMLIVTQLSARIVPVRKNTLLLTGVALSFLLSSLVTLIISLRRTHADRIIFWTMGSLSSLRLSALAWAAPIMIVSLGAFFYHQRELDLLSLGEEEARTTGLEVTKVRHRLLFFATLATATAVAISGIIGFVGLIVPHAMRFVFGHTHRKLLTTSLAFGAAFLLLCDTLARTIIAPSTLPLGVITAILGAPYFLFLLSRRSMGGGDNA